ncbi:hypothetical protein HXX76_003823 [Chlamydomonas incerta]|uniref:Mitochondrial ribosomal protein L19 n=1 Tax=Chlamydomonas incerta TaxID=51695 RepID=A0A835TLC5_CHLIN|nr:hypothetical protein HXX76_003823 [Chlamydomonas incerta]|eukprot:KAG2440970.1 hypothetical protein HXX76_003823 [Chlamydomonas incerta]
MLGALVASLGASSPRALSHYSASTSSGALKSSLARITEPCVLSNAIGTGWRFSSAGAGPSAPSALDDAGASNSAQPASAGSAASAQDATVAAPHGSAANRPAALSGDAQLSELLGEGGQPGLASTSSNSTGGGGRSSPPSGLPRLSLPQRVLRDLRPPAQPYTLAPKLAQRPNSTPALYTPWTPTRALQRRAHVSRRMGFLVHVLEREQMERVRAARPLPEFRAGDVLEVRMMVPEAERKVVVYRGVCIAVYKKGIRSSFKIYNVFPESGGVVQHIPLYMPDLVGLKVVGRIPASQERLYYLLERESGTSDYTFQTNVSTVK